MARGVNKVILVGNLGQDPETRQTSNNSAVTNITVATSESWTDKNTGNKEERTEWHRIVFFGKLAEIAGQYLRKGSKVYIEGSLRTRKWQDQQGQDRYTTEIVSSDMQMLDSRQDGQQQSNQSQAGQTGQQYQSPPPPSPTPNPQSHQQTPRANPQSSNQASGFGDFDDIPF